MSIWELRKPQLQSSFNNISMKYSWESQKCVCVCVCVCGFYVHL